MKSDPESIGLDVALYAVQMCERLEVICDDRAKAEIEQMRGWLQKQVHALAGRNGRTTKADRARRTADAVP